MSATPGSSTGPSRGPILTLTANPSFDRTVALPVPLERGAVHRVDAMTSQAGGKGVNISRAAVGAGLATIAVLPACEVVCRTRRTAPRSSGPLSATVRSKLGLAVRVTMGPSGVIRPR